MRDLRQMRSVPSKFQTRAEGDDLYIEGYFSVFGGVYELWDGASETIAPGAFSETLGGDIRALIDHESRLVLGRTTAGTLELREDDTGLWGRVKINSNDQDAMNLYERVRRGDVDQCSFGFDILDEETEQRENGEVRWTIRKVKLYEVSVVTFPAYQETSVTARKRDYEEIQKRKTEAWRESMRKKLKE
ncbi:MAG TPA: HK97 family phage prohead protease [Candidatus Butyricicoccus avicola]|nr:HK97 family phage prohead protease [Candidatus Butyricicoccus avicola]